MKPLALAITSIVTLIAACTNTPEVAQAEGLPATQFLALPEGRIAYDDTGGAGPLVIALPSMGDLRGEYRYLVPILRNAGYRVVTVDVRGHGETSTGWSDYSAHAVGKDVLALIDHLGARPAVIIGTSFSAGSALWATHDAPEKIRGIVMISPVVHDIPIPLYAKLAMAIGFSGPWRVPFWLWYWDSLFPMHKPRDQDAYRAALDTNLNEPGRMDALKAMVTLSKADTAGILGHATKPSLLVMGTADKDFDDPVSEAKSLASQLDAEMFVIEGAGHYPQVESPEAVGSLVIEFLRKLP